MGDKTWLVATTLNLRFDQRKRLGFIAEIEGCSMSKLAQQAVDEFFVARDKRQRALASQEVNTETL